MSVPSGPAGRAAPVLPAAVAAHLGEASLAPLWRALRARLERTGHAIRGVVEVDLDDAAADRLAGLLGRRVAPGTRRIKLVDLDAALRASAAGRGLMPVVAALTGGPLRDRPAERTASREQWAQVWAGLDEHLLAAGLAGADWIAGWLAWLHASGAVTRLGTADATRALRASAAALRELAPLAHDVQPSRSLGELAARTTGDAHGLDDGHAAAAFVLRAAALARGAAPPETAAGRRELWRRLGIEPDTVSGTVLVWALRPPGADAWSAMMRARADLGLVTHLTVRELRAHDVALAASGEKVHACENPQVLQAAADTECARPLICLSGNPSGAGLLLAARVRLRYHGDFDWPGIAIAARLIAAGARPWRMGANDYRAALARLPADARLPLTGTARPTPWDDSLASHMARTGAAVHEEALIDALLGDLR